MEGAEGASTQALRELLGVTEGGGDGGGGVGGDGGGEGLGGGAGGGGGGVDHGVLGIVQVRLHIMGFYRYLVKVCVMIWGISFFCA